jgi:HD-GYP domain-containing protein (c-di-GMP phosphodiesterase class II)
MLFPSRLLRRRPPRLSRANAAFALSHFAERLGAMPVWRARDVAGAAVFLGERLGWGRRRVSELAEAAKLLDVGLIGMPRGVTGNPRSLSQDEEEQYEQHPVRSLELACGLGLMGEQLHGIMHHHERYDGRGFPMGFAGQEIPEFARILAIADVYVQLTKPAPGGVALTTEDALDEMLAQAGAHFDPRFVAVFAREMRKRQTTSGPPRTGGSVSTA